MVKNESQRKQLIDCCRTRWVQTLTVRLQKRKTDISKAYTHIQTVKSALKKVRENVDAEHEKMMKAASDNGVVIEKPRICNIQKHRENYDVLAVSQYYRASLTIPFLDNVITAMDERYTPKNLAIYSGFNILPTVMLQKGNEKWEENFQYFVDVYFSTISDFGSIGSNFGILIGVPSLKKQKSLMTKIRNQICSIKKKHSICQLVRF